MQAVCFVYMMMMMMMLLPIRKASCQNVMQDFGTACRYCTEWEICLLIKWINVFTIDNIMGSEEGYPVSHNCCVPRAMTSSVLWADIKVSMLQSVKGFKEGKIIKKYTKHMDTHQSASIRMASSSIAPSSLLFVSLDFRSSWPRC